MSCVQLHMLHMCCTARELVALSALSALHTIMADSNVWTHEDVFAGRREGKWLLKTAQPTLSLKIAQPTLTLKTAQPRTYSVPQFLACVVLFAYGCVACGLTGQSRITLQLSMTLVLSIYGSNATIVNSEIKYFWQIHCLLYGILFNTEVKMRLSSYKAYFIFSSVSGARL